MASRPSFKKTTETLRASNAHSLRPDIMTENTMGAESQGLHAQQAQSSLSPDPRVLRAATQKPRLRKPTMMVKLYDGAASGAINVAEPDRPTSRRDRNRRGEGEFPLEALDDQERDSFWQKNDDEYHLLDALEARGLGVEVTDTEETGFLFENCEHDHEYEDNDAASAISSRPKASDFRVAFDYSLVYGDKEPSLSGSSTEGRERTARSDLKDSGQDATTGH